MEEAVIVATARSPIGRANKGSLVDVRADELLADILNSLMDKVPQVGKDDVIDIVAGCVGQQGETGFNVARTAGILAGFPLNTTGAVINRACASSLQAIRTVGHAINAGEGDIYIAAGVEKTSRPPQPEGEEPKNKDKPRTPGRGFGPGGLNPKLLGGESGFPFVYIPMGLTAENVVERFNVPREDMDKFAKLSQDRAVAAQENGIFEREITPITKADGTVVTKDDGPRAGTTLEKLASLPPAFKPDGQVTAGNSCPLNDGAAAVMVMSRSKADQLGIKPLARIICSAVSGNEPEIMGVAPIQAIPRALEKAGMTIKDVDVVELNEAFAAQVLPICWEVGIDIDTQLNPHGGAIALGHPFGQTGARIMTTLINDLQTLDKTIGVETMCAAGGMAMAMVIERLS